MKRGCLGLLLTLALSAAAFAGNGTCNNTIHDCTAAQICHPNPGHPCIVTISHNPDGTATVKVNDQATDIVCADAYRIEWQSVNATPSFTNVTFVGGRTPYSQNDILFDSSAPVIPAYVHVASGCYVFSATDCGLGAGATCGYADPKVVMPPQGFHVHHLHRPKPAQ
jgi:hypothetical protein